MVFKKCKIIFFTLFSFLMTNSTINVTVFIINSAARTFSLPTDATVSQLQAQAPELASGIFKNISNMSVEM
jgi:hypothetical protein